MQLNKKTLIITVAAVLILASAGFLIYKNYSQKKQQQAQEKQTKELAATKVNCPEEMAKMSPGQIIEAARDIGWDFATREQITEAWENITREGWNERLKAEIPKSVLSPLVKDLALKYLVCHTAKNSTTEDEYNEAKPLIKSFNTAEANETKYLMGLDLAYEHSVGRTPDAAINHPVYKLITYDKIAICPDGKGDSKIIKSLMGEMGRASVEIVGSPAKETVEKNVNIYCDQIEKYSKDATDLKNEIYEFKNWSPDLTERASQYRWKSNLAFRFSGEDKALGVCDNLSNSEEKPACKKRVNEIANWFLSFTGDVGIDCRNTDLKIIKDIICQLR